MKLLIRNSFSILDEFIIILELPILSLIHRPFLVITAKYLPSVVYFVLVPNKYF